MAENETQNQNQDPAAATPAGTPPPAAQPAATPPPAAAGQHQNGGGKNKGKRGPEVRIPVNQFKKRIQQEARGQAAKLIQEQLGVSLEEAKTILAKAKEGGAQPPADASARQVADDAVKKLQAENKRLQDAADKANRRAEDEAKKRQKEVSRLKEREILNHLNALAKELKINDPQYAIHLFARAAAAKPGIKPEEYFPSLKTTHPHLFAEVAAPIVPASTAPPESQQPGEVKPQPAPAGGQPGSAQAENVDDMSPQQFSKRTQSRYGYVQGM